MRAVTLDGSGSVVVADRPVPEPGPGQVRVAVRGAGLNRADLLQAAGRYPAPSGAPADIPGLEFSGTVERCGPGVIAPAVGDAVFGIASGGAQADAVVVPAGQCAPVPAGLDLVAAGGVPEAFVTAHDALAQCRLRSGERVLVHAAGSGVGTAAVQLAHAAGAMVIGTGRTAAKLERCRPLGLDHGVVATALPDGRPDVEALTLAVLALTDGADVVLDLVGGPYVEVDLAVAAPRGRIVLIGTLAGGTATLRLLPAMAKRLSVFGTVLRSRTDDEKAAATAAFTRDVVPLLASGEVAPVVETVLPLERAAEAYAHLASDATFGKIVLAP